MRIRVSSLPLIAAAVGAFALATFAAPKAKAEPKMGAIRVLFLGHESEHHNSNKYYPMLAKGLPATDYRLPAAGPLGLRAAAIRHYHRPEVGRLQ